MPTRKHRRERPVAGTSRTTRHRGNNDGNTGTISPAAGIVPMVTPAGTSRTIRPRGGNRSRGNTDGNTRSVVPAPATPCPTPRHTAAIVSCHLTRRIRLPATRDHIRARMHNWHQETIFSRGRARQRGERGRQSKQLFPGTIRPFTRTAGTMRPFTRSSRAPTADTHRGHNRPSSRAIGPRDNPTILSRRRSTGTNVPRGRAAGEPNADPLAPAAPIEQPPRFFHTPPHNRRPSGNLFESSINRDRGSRRHDNRTKSPRRSAETNGRHLRAAALQRPRDNLSD